MKIGILTYHRSNNYGALLQAVALRKVLADMGHQVTYIDYWPSYHRHMYALFSFHWMMSRKGINGKVKYLKSCIMNYVNRKARKKNFNLFIAEFIDPYTSSVTETYDAIVHGSDQIWRKQPEHNGYNPVYFGVHQISAKCKVSYAASMGILPTDDLSKAIVKEYLSALKTISVRENNLMRFVSDLGFTNVCQDLDPTLLLPADFWIKTFGLNKNKERYALYYKLQDSFDMNELRRYAESKRIKLKVIYHKACCADSEVNVTTAGPRQFLQLIYGAEIVFTSSFHGLAFSLIFNKPFFASFVKNVDRAKSLLKVLNVSDRLLKPKVDIPNIINDLDFCHENMLLQDLQKNSLKSLSSMINEE